MCNAQDKIRKLLHKIAKEENFHDYELKVKPISTEGANYSSFLYVASITDGTQELNVFIKVAAMKEKMREQMPLKIYDTEMYVYSELKIVYRALEDKYQLPEKHRLYIPKYYGANTTFLEEIIVLENLACKGFTSHDRMKSIDWDYAATAVIELAKLHALSVALQREYPLKFKQFTEEIIADWLNENVMKAFWTTGFETTLNVLGGGNREKMKRFLDTVDLAELRMMNKPLRCKVLTHGDYRPSNLMHKRNDSSIQTTAKMNVEQRMQNLLHKIAKEQNYTDYNIDVTSVSTAGANFSSALYYAKITSRTDVLDLFIKISQIGAKVRESFKITIFETERFIYSNLRSLYMEIEARHNIPSKHCVYLPKYYGADTTPPNEVLVLENLAVKGFVIHDRFKSIDWEYASNAVTELVKLHSLSMSYQREYPKEFMYFSENHQYEWLNQFTVTSLWEPGFKKAIDAAPDNHKQKLVKFFSQCDLEKITRMYDTLRCEVLTHGDYRPSNLMHRRRRDGSLEIIAVDHQTIQIGCPVIDLLYLIFTGTDKDFRDQYFDQLIDFYYQQLSAAMKRLNIDPEATYSRADFDFEMKEKLPFGLAVAAFILPIITVEPEHAPEVSNDMDLNTFSVEKTGALFPSRINGVVDDYIKWGILKD